ncbi:CBS domain-containing protein [Actinophytocola algeriensis]|uniref:CBS domain-containing protein n=1 Tax=Actinophytocola algeriensis TaxID=1768010 RepID=A0A7W7Q755_9PSEU|nr:CBS domain-containing protein [Actinophytocola algeriensis]MBB4908093.1 CBS domain-containing protein [Actinophytocola algeriensis]MBE1480123.1 CBS domain-containing protein [Actinophytocola algeriensis]
MRVADLLRSKGSEVATVPPRVSVSGLLEDLARHNIGAMVVADETGGVIGIVSERDVVRQLHDRGAELLTAPVEEIMTTQVVTCGPNEGVDSLAAIMTERRIRHMPVLEDGRLIGIVSIGDVVKSRIQQLESDRDQLESYIARG